MSDDNSPFDAFHERATNRRLLIRAVAEGRYTPEQAEAIAETEGYGPLLPNPTYDEIDGFAEPAWSLLMAFAWVAWGQSPTHVRNYFAPYRLRLQVWKRHGAGHRPESADMHHAYAAVELSRKDSHDDFASAIGKVGEARASLAWDRLTAKFRSGEIATEGQLVNDLAAGIVQIPAKNWRTLLLMPPTGALVDALCYADGNPIYFNVTVDKEQLLTAFPHRSEGLILDAVVNAENAPNPPVPLAAPDAPKATNLPSLARRKGRKEKYPWESFFAQCEEVWNYNQGVADNGRSFFENAAPFEREMAQWCETRPVAQWHGGPKLTQLRKKVAEFLQQKARDA